MDDLGGLGDLGRLLDGGDARATDGTLSAIVLRSARRRHRRLVAATAASLAAALAGGGVAVAEALLPVALPAASARARGTTPPRPTFASTGRTFDAASPGRSVTKAAGGRRLAAGSPPARSAAAPSSGAPSSAAPSSGAPSSGAPSSGAPQAGAARTGRRSAVDNPIRSVGPASALQCPIGAMCVGQGFEQRLFLREADGVTLRAYLAATPLLVPLPASGDPGTAGGSSAQACRSVATLIVEASDAGAVGTLEVPGRATSMPAAAPFPALDSAILGAPERSPMVVVVARVGATVERVHARFAGGTTDSMAPVGGWVALADAPATGVATAPIRLTAVLAGGGTDSFTLTGPTARATPARCATPSPGAVNPGGPMVPSSGSTAPAAEPSTVPADARSRGQAAATTSGVGNATTGAG